MTRREVAIEYFLWASGKKGKQKLADFIMGLIEEAVQEEREACARLANPQAGLPFVERVDLDDFVFDIHARR